MNFIRPTLFIRALPIVDSTARATPTDQYPMQVNSVQSPVICGIDTSMGPCTPTGGASGNLSGDITHSIKIFLAKEFAITPVFSVSLGGSFNASSGPPIEPNMAVY